MSAVASALRVVDDVEPLARDRGWPYRVCEPAGRETLLPSTTLVGELEELVTHRARFLEQHEARTHRAKSAAEIWTYYARLYAATAYETPRTFTCELDDALVLEDTGLVVTANGEALAESSLVGGVRGAKLWLTKAAAHVDGAPALAGRYVSLVSFDARNYAQWLQDCLPRLTLLAAGDTSFRVLVQSRPERFQLESLELLGVDPSRIVEMPAPAVRVESLVLARASARLNRPVGAHAYELRRRALEAAGARHDDTAGGRPLYVSREGSRRPVVNEHELDTVRRRHALEVVRPHELSFGEQVRAFAGARAIVGPHGAGLHNQLFAPVGAPVVEAYGRGLFYLSVLRAASLAGQRHWHVFGETMDEAHGLRVDPRKLDAVLELALSAGSAA